MEDNYSSLTNEEKLELLNLEANKIKHEINISKLIYSYHDSDCYEDLFRDNIPSLQEKLNGILISIKNLKEED